MFDKQKVKIEYPKDGRVHSLITQISFTEIGAVAGSGKGLDNELQKLQDAGCEIINVTAYASGSNNKYVQAVILYRAPYIPKAGDKAGE